MPLLSIRKDVEMKGKIIYFVVAYDTENKHYWTDENMLHENFDQGTIFDNDANEWITEEEIKKELGNMFISARNKLNEILRNHNERA
jgi:hypothetical protein